MQKSQRPHIIAEHQWYKKRLELHARNRALAELLITVPEWRSQTVPDINRTLRRFY